MPRPQKYTVDYFPHDANSSDGRTLTILFNNFGHEGISAWWQLLERVSSTNNHVICIRNPEDLEYLAAKLHFQPERLKEILNKLSSLGAIDPDLYVNGYIWCQNFVDRIEPVYKSRKQVVPIKPTVSLPDNPVSLPDNPVSLPDNTQTKLKETKLNINSSNNRGENPENNLAEITTIFEQEIGHITPMASDTLKDLTSHYPRDWVKEAINLAVKSNARNIRYVEGILKRWETEGKGDKKKNENTKRYTAIPGNQPSGAFDDIESD